MTILRLLKATEIEKDKYKDYLIESDKSGRKNMKFVDFILFTR
jgi:hypothetical protein